MDNTPVPTPPTPAADSAEQRIFDAAHEVFVQKGLDGAKMQEIADRAGINKALLHYYYRSKEKLYEMVAKAVINRAFPIIRQLIESDDPLEQKITRFIDFYIDLVSRNPFVPLFVITELNKHPDRFFETILPKELLKPSIFFAQVEAEIAKGTLRPIQPQHLLVNIVSLCIFPFVARPMLRIVLGLQPPELAQFLSERKAEVKKFVFQAIKP
ncbi:MAG: TetR/AcrR family transcriptional regulator [Saprospiraceae bacterium]|nr:TetR/AcrR family transcriptional regulator [Saprospiraceae bacterium]